MDKIIFASDAEDFAPLPDLAEGWASSLTFKSERKPKLSNMNFAFNRIDKNAMEHITAGIHEFDEKLAYKAGSITKYKSKLWIAMENIARLSPADTAEWVELIPESSTETTGLVKLYNGVDSTSTTVAGTANSVKLLMTE